MISIVGNEGRVDTASKRKAERESAREITPKIYRIMRIKMRSHLYTVYALQQDETNIE